MKKTIPKKYLKRLGELLVVVAGSFIIFLLLQNSFPPAAPRLKRVEISQYDYRQVSLNYVALGDSLTEGIGDQTNRGGFVPILAEDVATRYRLKEIQSQNFGVSGERSDQILTRLKEDQELRKGITKADFLTITVGGNDLMKVIRKDFFGLSLEMFTQPRQAYQKRVGEMLAEIRSLNAEVPIYLLGIYNPFYLNFPEVTDMQKVVDEWNTATEETTKEYQMVYFIPINDLLYQGLNQQAVEAPSSSQSTGESASLTIDNNVLYDVDNFHPNNTGYQLMANAVRDQMIETQETWLKKGETNNGK